VPPTLRSGEIAICRFVGIDYGTKRIGLAVGAAGGCIVSPLATVEATGDLDAQIERILCAVKDYEVDHWVVGLPLNMDGSDSEQTRITRRFAKAFSKRVSQPVHLWDERLSSRQADEYLAAAQLTLKKRKARRDRLAAQIILQTFLDALTDDTSPQ
ncbi:MAG: Holliday junction resolvase RuvX, partial [Phycisphaerae bacterium]|nr:Holliday junction resolvase RuvX [Phycisphaerae bacterium]